MARNSGMKAKEHHIHAKEGKGAVRRRSVKLFDTTPREGVSGRKRDSPRHWPAKLVRERESGSGKLGKTKTKLGVEEESGTFGFNVFFFFFEIYFISFYLPFSLSLLDWS